MPDLAPLRPEDHDGWLADVRGRLVAARQAPGILPPERAVALVDGLLARLLPDGPDSPDQHVVTGDGVTVWFCTGDDPTLIDLHAPGREQLGLHAAEGAARAEGVRRLKAVAFEGQPALADAYAAAGYTTLATQMWRDVRAARTGTRRVSVADMTGAERDAFTAHETESYAADMTSVGLLPPELALEAARTQVSAHLDDPGSRLLTGWTPDGLAIGDLWLELTPPTAFVLQVAVRPEQRGRGYGRDLMIAAEDTARSAGADLLGLSVFGDNAIARRLYDSLGYTRTEDLVARDL